MLCWVCSFKNRYFFDMIIKIFKDNGMKKVLFALVAISSLAFAFDMGKIADSVDGDKAKASVDQEKAMEAVTKGDISVDAVKRSVDGEKAVDSVDKEKLMKSVF